MLALIPFSAIATWRLVRRTLAPITTLRSEIATRDCGNLTPLSTPGLPSELAPIGSSVDRLLDRVRSALEGERDFATNSAHELRTPLAGALAQTQRLIRELPKGPAKARALGIERSLTGLGHLTEKLLQLSRADAGIGVSHEANDLMPVVRLVMTDFERRLEFASRLEFRTNGVDSLWAKVDVDAFGIALRNLIENALVHGAADQPVRITLSSKGSVSVSNAGPVVLRDDLSSLTRRFKRGSSDATGSGLGLAIASTLAERMGGALTLHSPARNRPDGFEATLSLPGGEA